MAYLGMPDFEQDTQSFPRRKLLVGYQDHIDTPDHDPYALVPPSGVALQRLNPKRQPLTMNEDRGFEPSSSVATVAWSHELMAEVIDPASLDIEDQLIDQVDYALRTERKRKYNGKTVLGFIQDFVRTFTADEGRPPKLQDTLEVARKAGVTIDLFRHYLRPARKGMAEYRFGKWQRYVNDVEVPA